MFSIFLLMTIFSEVLEPQDMQKPGKEFTMLSLGDSYTIGEQVDEADRFPNQTVLLLHSKGFFFEKPKIIATTGWTTGELMNAIEKENIQQTYDFVTLLIGVNNQYRGQGTEQYRKEFAELLKTAVNFSEQKSNHVIVLSIPDWGATPFAEGRDRKKIAFEIDEFNSINKEESKNMGVHYIDITPVSRMGASNSSFLAGDGLHPSGKMYSEWAQELSKVIELELK